MDRIPGCGKVRIVLINNKLCGKKASGAEIRNPDHQIANFRGSGEILGLLISIAQICAETNF